MSKVRYKMSSFGFFFILMALIHLSTSKLTLTKGDVEFESRGNDFYTITFDENLANIVLFNIEGAEGNLTLEVNDCLELEQGYKLDRTQLILTQPLDYERKNCKNTNVVRDSTTGTTASFRIILNNLDDNAPQFKLDSNNCEFEENKDYPVESSTCKMEIMDLDGMLDQASLLIKEGDAKTFGVTLYPKPKPEDEKATVVIYLQNNVQLDYETMTSYVLMIKAQEQVNTAEIQIAINVKDEPDQPPKFIKIITIEQFEENVDQTFQVKAIDGDIGINSTITYEIRKNDCEKYGCSIEIDENSGEINVKNVDREKIDNSTISLTIAAKEEDGNSTELPIKFFIIDQDDEWPKITMDETEVSVQEGYKGTITKLSVEDMDLSDAGTFTITLDKGDKVDYTEAFELIPDSGYQNASFILTVINSTLLDYENDDWKVIKFNIIATEKADNSHTDSKGITINLIDINDEPPIFENEATSVDIPEDIGAGEEIFDASATDKDAGDTVTYEILGIWSKNLDISENGIITTKEANTFDYEILSQVFISIKASDNDEVHTTIKTLTINVLDVDDEPPVMRVNITTHDKMAKIEENSGPGTTVEGVSVVVTDPDTKPALKLEIDWESTFVTKNSRIVKLEDEEYQCFSVKTGPQKQQTIQGTIEINNKCSPDFEKFDAIVLFLKATDVNTVKGADSTTGSVSINIVDINDNSPQFIDSSLKNLYVTDGTNTVTKIGIVTAKDDDIGDKLYFTIKPAEGEPDWVTIDQDSGELSVKKGVVIDCDVPRRADIKYYITVHDPDPSHDNSTKVSIRIDDTNDQTPKIIAEKSEVHMEEKSANNTRVIKLDYTDLDRDYPYNSVVFKLDTNISDEAANRFSIDRTTGLISVNLRNEASLDRDVGPPSFILPVLAYDNPKGTLQLRYNYDLKIILDDLDDNIPKLDIQVLESSEKASKDSKLVEIEAYDPDEDGLNSNVFFELKKVFALNEDNSKLLDKTFFDITKTSAKNATIKLVKSLESYWGLYNLTITTKDEGNPSQSIDNDVTLTVEKFNFKEPVFVFPKTETERKVTIDKDVTSPKSTIVFPDGEKLKNLAVDDQQNHKWDVTFVITDENGGDPDIFRIIKDPIKKWEGTLQTTRHVSDTEAAKDYSVTVRASVKADMKDGEAPGFVDTTLKIKFFSYTEQPKFNTSNAECEIEENAEVKLELPAYAYFSDTDVVGIIPYYFIYPSTDIINLNSTTRLITADHPFDYEKNNKYEIKVVALNKNSYPTEPPKSGDPNLLNLKLNIIDMNDHVPVFNPTEFTGAFLRNYNKDTVILTVNATDGDPTLQRLKFSLTNFNCSETLKAPEIPFDIGELDGKITNKFTVTSDMSGYCEFLVIVEDEPDRKGKIHKESTTVLINVISSDELVKFTFNNEDWVVHKKQDEVTKKIDNAFEDYEYKSYLADITYSPEWGNSTANFYFLSDSSKPVPASEILGNLTDPTRYSKLHDQLQSIGIILYYFAEPNADKVEDDYLKVWLIVTTIVSASLLALMSVIFFFRNKALTRRINNLSTTRFGSQDSGLNRAGVTAPTTNKNAVEGSNPVFNLESYIKEVDDDRRSVLSGDSDLLGVENNPNFNF